ncbi:MAG: hypothetical protein QM681_22075 [Novosphingobium sp.]
MMLSLIALAGALTGPRGDQALAEQLWRRIQTAQFKNPMYRMVTLVISPEGEVISCEPGEGKGDKASLEKVCSVVKSLRYGGKASIDGKPAYGRTRTIISSFDGPADRPNVSLLPELDMQVDRLPSDTGGELRLAVNVQVSALGRVERCEETQESRKDYAQVACKQLLGVVRPVVTDPIGIAVPYVENISARFTTGLANISGVSK